MKVGTEKRTGGLQKRIPVGNLTSRTLNPSQKWVVYFQSPPEKDKDKATGVTYRELDDLVEHDIGGDVEIEDKILEGKEES